MGGEHQIRLGLSCSLQKKLSTLQIMVADPSNHELAQKSMDVVNVSLILKNHISPNPFMISTFSRPFLKLPYR
jgi:hypothetical protein